MSKSIWRRNVTYLRGLVTDKANCNTENRSHRGVAKVTFQKLKVLSDNTFRNEAR